MRAHHILSLTALCVAAACAGDRQPVPRNGTVLFLSDFGTRDGAVAACKGVMLGIDPTLRIVDLTHEIPPYDVQAAAEVLEQSLPYYGAGTVAVAVVDPGVGSERKSIAIRTQRGHLLVGPDNGVFTLVLDAEGLDRAVELRQARYFRADGPSYTFHGRDVFAPVAAHLAAGVPLDSLGPPAVPMRLQVPLALLTAAGVEGVVRYLEDPYGNVVTNVPMTLLDSLGVAPGDTLAVRIGRRSHRLPFRRTFSDVRIGAPVALAHSRDVLSFSINQGDFAARFGVRRGDSVSVRRATRR